MTRISESKLHAEVAPSGYRRSHCHRSVLGWPRLGLVNGLHMCRRFRQSAVRFAFSKRPGRIGPAVEQPTSLRPRADSAGPVDSFWLSCGWGRLRPDAQRVRERDCGGFHRMISAGSLAPRCYLTDRSPRYDPVRRHTGRPALRLLRRPAQLCRRAERSPAALPTGPEEQVGLTVPQSYSGAARYRAARRRPWSRP
jgi:hypothetical protein